MIHILVTVHPSVRFPGKNKRLAPYTIQWLLSECAYAEEEVRVYTVGARAELPLRLPRAWQHILTKHSSHQAAVEAAERIIAPQADDILMLVQLTQPLREHGLVERAAALLREKGHMACRTAAPMPSTAWRAVNGQGDATRKHEADLLADGQLYAWRPGHAAAIFAAESDCGVLEINHSWGLVDVNREGDIPPALDAMAGAMLYAPVEPPPLLLEGRRVLLIGSGKDLVGRGLGERIDAGEWDLVVRCNHFHGDPADVGTRTDIAVLRISKLEKSFMEEAPVAPKRMIVHTSGEVIPLELLVKAAEEVGHKEASCGVIAALWLRENGAKVTAVGIGHRPDGTWEKAKFYANGVRDTALFCDWDKEHAWWDRQQNVTLL